MNYRALLYVIGTLVMIGGATLALRSEDAPIVTTSETLVDDGIIEWACPSGTVGRVSCAFVEVPENYDDPDVDTVRLFTARIAPPLEVSGPPIVYIGGELGGVTVGDFGAWQAMSRSTGREIVLVDLRGGGRSEPRFECPEYRNVEWLGGELAAEALAEGRVLRADALRSCRTGLADEIPIRQYSMTSVIRDLESVRERLGISSWTIAAGGEATLIARALADEQPSTVVSLVLIGAYPDASSRVESAVEYAESVLEIGLGPDVLADLNAAIETLVDRPTIFAVPSQGRTAQVLVSTRTVRATLARALGDDSARDEVVPLITERLADEQWRGVAVLRADQYRPSSRWSVAAAAALTCGDPALDELPAFWGTDDEPSTDLVGLVDDPLLDPATCDAWPGEEFEVVSSVPDVPTLVVNGEFDITAPRLAADAVSVAWPAAEVVVLPTGRPSPFDGCVVETVQVFLGAGAPSIGAECA